MDEMLLITLLISFIEAIFVCWSFPSLFTLSWIKLVSSYAFHCLNVNNCFLVKVYISITTKPKIIFIFFALIIAFIIFVGELFRLIKIVYHELIRFATIYGLNTKKIRIFSVWMCIAIIVCSLQLFFSSFFLLRFEFHLWLISI